MTQVPKFKLTGAAFIEKTPVGSMALAATEVGLAQAFFCSRADYDVFADANGLDPNEEPAGVLKDAQQQIAEYFEGLRKSFVLPFDLRGYPPFRTKALLACADIPFGETIFYAELAERASSPNAARAAGGAMANNPIALIIPCHRVVGTDGSLHGYSSPGGLKTKAALLRFEGVAVMGEQLVEKSKASADELAEMTFRSGYVAVVGRPNVGKSTLINKLLRQKIAAVSSKPQTTRLKQLGILTEDNYQIIFIDTPGIHLPRHTLGEGMNAQAQEALTDADVVLWLVDVSAPPHEEDNLITKKLAALKKLPPVIQVLNKADLTNAETFAQHQADYKVLFPNVEQVAVSAKVGSGVDEIQAMLGRRMPVGEALFPPDQVTDYYEREIAADLIRESALELLREEVPHAIAVRVDEYLERGAAGARITATIFVEKESQKGIVIGKGAEMLKAIGSRARLAIEAMSSRKVYLELRVKVKKDWRSNPDFLRHMGYENLKSN